MRGSYAVGPDSTFALRVLFYQECVRLTRSSSVVYREDAWFVRPLPSKFSLEHSCSNALVNEVGVDNIVGGLVIFWRCDPSKIKQLYINLCWNLTRVCVEICDLETAKIRRQFFVIKSSRLEQSPRSHSIHKLGLNKILFWLPTNAKRNCAVSSGQTWATSIYGKS